MVDRSNGILEIMSIDNEVKGSKNFKNEHKDSFELEIMYFFIVFDFAKILNN